MDLGLSWVRFRVSDRFAEVDGLNLRLDLLSRVTDRRTVYVLEEDSLKPVAFWGGTHFYKLVPVACDKAPTLEVDGIHMHRVSGVTPWDDAGLKVSVLGVRRGMRVLDVGTGLGYTAILSRMRGGLVVSVERDVNVLEAASYNPWSRRLESPSIKIILGDAYEIVESLPEDFFDRILHDPPRFSLAGELYSLEFYRRVYRILKPGGVLLHYTGKPGSLQGRRIVRGVARRLKAVGFRDVRWVEGVQGFRCVKLRSS